VVVARKADITAVTGFFANRAYAPDGTLIPRQIEGAVTSDEGEVVRRSNQMVAQKQVVAIDGSTVEVEASSLCRLHRDTPGAVSLARSVRRGLEEAGIALRAFTCNQVDTEYRP
jgi:UPF0271 protein